MPSFHAISWNKNSSPRSMGLQPCKVVEKTFSSSKIIRHNLGVCPEMIYRHSQTEACDRYLIVLSIFAQLLWTTTHGPYYSSREIFIINRSIWLILLESSYRNTFEEPSQSLTGGHFVEKRTFASIHFSAVCFVLEIVAHLSPQHRWHEKKYGAYDCTCHGAFGFIA